MNLSPHRLRRLRLRLAIAEPARAMEARSRLRADLDTALLPALERVMEEECPPDVEIHIPRLEIRLRLDRLEELEHLPRLVGEALRRELRELLPRAEQRRGSTAPTPGEVGADGLASGPPEESTALPTRTDLATLELSRLLAYLERGVVPDSPLDWPPDRSALATLLARREEEVIARLLRGELSAAAVYRWLALRSALPEPRSDAPDLLPERAPTPVTPEGPPMRAGEPPPEPQRDAAPVFSPAGAPDAERLSTEPRAQTPPPEEEDTLSSRDSGLRRLVALFALLHREPPSASPRGWLPLGRALAERARRGAVRAEEVDELARALMPPESWLALVEDAALIPELGPLVARWRRDLESAPPQRATVPSPEIHPESSISARAVPAPPPAESKSALLEEPGGLPPEGPGGYTGPERELSPELERFEPRPPEPSAGADLAVYDAGMVLLHPYLRPFLGYCGVLAEDRVPEALRPRALSLLSRLLIGLDEPFEPQLGLCRILLGLAPDDEVLLSPGLISEADEAECEDLLRTLIQHWGALGHSSPAGLRATFLQRPGLLRRGARQWHLKVQAAPYDVLLGRLPWGLSVVRLPWMAWPLFTTWEVQ